MACLLYHRIAAPDQDPYAFLTRGGVPATSPQELEWDLRYLTRLGARFMTFDQILSGEFPEPHQFGVIVAFDDCFADNYTTGRDILETMGIKAVFFQTTGLIDARSLIWEHALYWHTRNPDASERFHKIANTFLTHSGHPASPDSRMIAHHLRERTPYEIVCAILAEANATPSLTTGMPQLPGNLYPSADHVRAAHQVGHEIGSHGHLHLKRDTVSADLFRDDLVHSRSVLAGLLDEPPRTYSFPFSSHMPGDDAICRQAAFELVATVERNRHIERPITYFAPRFTWPGPARNRFRQRRWLLTGRV